VERQQKFGKLGGIHTFGSALSLRDMRARTMAAPRKTNIRPEPASCGSIEGVGGARSTLQRSILLGGQRWLRTGRGYFLHLLAVTGHGTNILGPCKASDKQIR